MEEKISEMSAEEKKQTDGKGKTDEGNEKSAFKKAKYAWQIKGRARMNTNRNFRQGRRRESGKKDELADDNNTTRVNRIEEFRLESIERLPVHGEGCTVSKNPSATSHNPIALPQGYLEDSSVPVEVRVRVPAQVPAGVPLGLATGRPSVCLPPEVAAQCVDEFLSMLNRTNYNLRKWQTKQMAKAIIDNAINKVLEDMGFIPLPADAFDFHLVDSAAESNDISPQNIESKGVSEAIRQQGLHRRPPWADSTSATANNETQGLRGTTCTCWLHWKPNSTATQTDARTEGSGGRKEEGKRVEEEEEDGDADGDGRRSGGGRSSAVEPESVLDAAVSFAISEKGLGVFSDERC